MGENGYILEMLDITKEFPGVKALDNVKLQVAPGTVHALMGENGAGKSTLMKCLFGIYHKDAGRIIYNGEEVNFTDPKHALDNGISMVHQELNQVLARSVMENIWLGRFPTKGILIDHKKMYDDTKVIFEDLGIDVDPRQIIGDLSVSQRQMIEIAKAVSYDSKILIFDEPTSSLTEREVDHLFEIIDRLRERGLGMVYISHKMDEIFKIADDITIMRDGKWVHTGPVKELNMDRIISLMVGRDMTERFPEKTNVVSDEVILKVEGLTGEYQPTVVDASFEVHAGEILGISGLVGARRTELVETIFGYRTRHSGKIYYKGEEIKIKNPLQAIKKDFALLTEERRATGIFGDLSVLFNSTISHLDAYAKFGVVDNKKMAKDTQWVIDSMAVKTPSQKQAIGNLSGGNQQKVIIGRWLLNEPEVLMMDEPTRGIDVGAKYEIYKLMNDLASRGKAIIFVSSEMPELLGVADRIMVMSNGHVAGIVNAKETDQEELLRLAAKYL
ncbi:MAG: galactose/methyl galactoside ABC transporter ATP-binding protein MglA [Lachnospiraceae bacterium]|nr:galactose/methyl galactoside ABC transporter ATP-binding protein MglA [Lachnospiraceae bacterium]